MIFTRSSNASFWRSFEML